MKSERVNNGDRVRDRVTGFKGIAVARTEWLNGCVRITIQPETLDKGKVQEGQTIDEPQLEIIKRNAVPNVLTNTHGPRDDKLATSR